MSKDPLFEHLREQAWRGKLSPGQKAQLQEWLAAHPEAREDWESEAGVSEALGQLPDVHVPNNFTARVLEALELEAASAQRKVAGARWFGRQWLWRSVAACAIVLAGLITIESRVQRLRTERLANDIAAVYRVTPQPNPEILANFDVICALDRTPPPDEDLLKLLQ